MEKLENKKTLNPQEIIKEDWETWKKDFAHWEELKAELRAEINKHNKNSIEYKVLSNLFSQKCYYKEHYFMIKASEIYNAQQELNKKQEAEQTK